MASDREALLDILPKGSHKHVDKIIEYFGDRDDFSYVEIRGARVGVEEIEAYGLTIRLDANRRAVSVFSLDGMEIIQ